MAGTSYTNAAGIVLQPSGTATNWVSATAAAQTLVGDNGNDVFWDMGGGGNTLIGGTGSNVFNINNGNDRVVVAAGGGVNTVASWATTYVLAANVQNLTLEYSGQTGTGNTLDNIVTAGSGTETLDGGGGNDVLVAGTGSDTFIVRSAYTGSVVIVGYKPGVDHVQLAGFTGLLTMAQISANLSQSGADAILGLGNGQTLVFRNTTVSQLTAADFGVPATSSGLILNGLGQALTMTPSTATKWLSATVAGQVLTGDNGNDVFWDLVGSSNTIVLGTGNNVLNLQDQTDTIRAGTSWGVNTVVLQSYNMYYTLPTFIQNLTLTDPGQYGTGNSGNNIITGGAGAETLDGGGGSDALIAGTGADIFVVKSSYAGSDSIAGFKTATDQVQLSGFTNFTSFAQVSAAMTQVGADTVLNLGNGNNLVFRNLSASSLTAANFLLPLSLAGRTMTFGSNFTSFSSSPDGSSGVYKTSYFYGARTLPANGEIEYYNDASTGTNPFSVSGGVLSITAQQQAGPQNTSWSSGLITTQSSFSQLYGVFEMRAALPAGAGMFPAFWLLPSSGAWPPELDVMEMIGSNASVITESTHTGSSNTISTVATRVTDTQGYHTYDVDWEPNTITWYFDGTAIASMATPADMHTAMYMVANLGVGGTSSWGGTTNASTPSTDVMKIAYMRAYASAATPTYAGSTPGNGSAVPITPATVGGPALSAAQMLQVTADGGDGTITAVGSKLTASLGTADATVVLSKASLSSTVVQQGATALITGFTDANDTVMGAHDFLALTGFSSAATITFDHLGTATGTGGQVTTPTLQYYKVADTDGFSALIKVTMADGSQHLGSHAAAFV